MSDCAMSFDQKIKLGAERGRVSSRDGIGDSHACACEFAKGEDEVGIPMYVATGEEVMDF